VHFRESSKCPNPSVSPPPPQSLPLGGVAAERSSGLRRRRCRRQSSKFPNPRQSPLPRWPRVTARYGICVAVHSSSIWQRCARQPCTVRVFVGFCVSKHLAAAQ
jgi:hypothetical protein